MKIAVCSDLHLEFGGIELKNTESADVLILSGDICLASKMEKFMGFFEHVNSEFPVSLMVMGNHEHYNGDFAKSPELIKQALVNLPNVHLLDKEIFKVNDVTFIGSTLWTDMNDDDPMTKFHVGDRMNDFRCVDNSNRMVTRTVPIYELNPDYTEDGNNGLKYATKEGGGYIQIGTKRKESISAFSPDDAMEDFNKNLDYIRLMVEGKFDEKFVVVGHHAPSKASTHPRYQHESLMNGAYSSNLDEFIMERPQIKLWTHGHTHEDFDYMLGSTRIVCNPRGYINHESRADNFKLKVVTV
jgi:Icc-related predicted phosphoesterase